MAANGKRPADARTLFQNLTHQNVKLWLLRCEDDFKRNPRQWSSEQDHIKYVIVRMEGEEVPAIALTNRKKTTAGLGHLKIEEYEYWEIFRIQCITRFVLTHERERALAAMEKIIYTGNIDRFLLEFENHNTYVELVGMVLRLMVERTLPKEVVKRLVTDEHALDSDWMAALREQTTRDETFLEE